MLLAERFRHRLRRVVEIRQRPVRAESEHRVWIETRKRGKVLDFLLGAFALRNIARNNDDAAWLAFRVRGQTCRRIEQMPAPFTISIAQPCRSPLSPPPRLAA